MLRARRRAALFVSCLVETESQARASLGKPLVFHLRYASQVLQIRSRYLNPEDHRAFSLIQSSITTAWLITALRRDGNGGNGGTGRYGKTAVKMVPPSRPADKLPDRRHLPSRPADKISPVGSYRPVPPCHRTITAPSRRDTEKLPSRPADKIFPAKLGTPADITCLFLCEIDALIRGGLFPSIPNTNHEINKIKWSCTKF